MTDAERISHLTIISTVLVDVVRDLASDVHMSEIARARLHHNIGLLDRRIEALSVAPTREDALMDNWRDRERSRLNAVDPIRHNRQKAKG